MVGKCYLRFGCGGGGGHEPECHPPLLPRWEPQVWEIPPGVSPVIPKSWLECKSLDEQDYNDQMAEMSAQMEKLDKEVNRLERQEKLEAMRHRFRMSFQKTESVRLESYVTS